MATNGKKCSVKGCGKNPTALGFCPKHYQRYRITGTSELIEKKQSICSIDSCDEKMKAKGFCSKHYQRFMIHGDPNFLSDKIGQPIKFKSIQHNFESRFEKSDPGSCWIWKGSVDKNGYGELCVYSKGVYRKYRATRLSYTFYVGEVADKMLVCHKCDNPICVNPNHLFLGTAQDNANDMVNKSRSMKGEKNNTAKLTEENVFYIRKKIKEGESYLSLSKKFNVCKETIARVVRNESWTHIKEK